MKGREIFCHQVSFFSSWVKGSEPRGAGAFAEEGSEEELSGETLAVGSFDRGRYLDDGLADAGSCFSS